MAGRIGAPGRNRTRTSQIWNNVFNFTDEHLMTEEDIDNLSLDQWKVFVRAVEEPHGIVTNGSEPVFVKPGDPDHPFHDEVEGESYLTEQEKEVVNSSSTFLSPQLFILKSHIF